MSRHPTPVPRRTWGGAVDLTANRYSPVTNAEGVCHGLVHSRAPAGPADRPPHECVGASLTG